MTSANWISIIAAAVAAVAAGLAWFMAHRTRSLTAYYQTSTALVQLNQIFIENPELRPYFIEGGKLPKGQTQKARAMGSLILNMLEAIASQEKALGKDELAAWENYIKHQVRSVKIINEHYESQKHWYPNITRLLG